MEQQSGIVFTKGSALDLIEIAVLTFSQNGILLRSGLYIQPTVDPYRLPRMITEAMGLQIHTPEGLQVTDFILDPFIDLAEWLSVKLLNDDFFLLEASEKSLKTQLYEYAFDQRIKNLYEWFEFQSIEVLNKNDYDYDDGFEI